MRIVGNIPHPELKITVLEMGEKYHLKIEGGPMEQTFKFEKSQIHGLEEFKKFVDSEFLDATYNRFNDMFESIKTGITKLNHNEH